VKTLLIIPCYNEQEAILDLYREVQQKVNFDVLVVNDCSTDSSAEILKRYYVPHLNLLVNLGIGGAMQAGYRYALKNHYDIAVQLDGDGQHDPADIFSLVAPIEHDEADMVIGPRFLKREGFQSSAVRRAGIGVFKLLLFCLTGKKITDATSGFRAVNRNVMKLFDLQYAQDFPEPESTMLVLRNHLRIMEISVKMRERQGGMSSIRGFSSVYYMFKVSFSILLCAIQPRIRV
jgi:glycosyltransferase involved in cell wall biosynthesis